MRTISAASLAKLVQKTGTEPVLIVEVEWQAGQIAVYSDKKVDGVDPRILQVSGIEDVVNVSKTGTSQSITITLDDTDRSLLTTFNTVDIHKKRVRVYQWFSGISMSDRFLLFAGQIMSPISWKEGDRTLTFTVTSQFDEVEVGFSAEEGDFPNLPQNLVGQTWPLVFGTVQKLPCILIDDIPYGTTKSGSAADSITQEGTGIRDPALDPAIKDNDNQAGYAAALAQVMFIGYLQASFTARKNKELGDLDPIDVGKGQFSNLAKQYLQQGNQYLLQSQKLRHTNKGLKVVLQKQIDQEKPQIDIMNGRAFPQAKETRVNLGGAVHIGSFSGDTFSIADRIHPDSEIYDGVTTPNPAAEDPSSPTFGRTTFFWADAGTPVRMSVFGKDIPPDPAGHPSPTRYIIAANLQVSVLSLYAYRVANDVKSLYPIPVNYYSIYQLNFGVLPVTLAYMATPLSSRVQFDGKSEGWEDDVYATCTSSVGPNTVDIIQWLIQKYTKKTIDADSFALARSLVATYPMHFAVLDRPQVTGLISQIARQARCMIWLKNDVFFIKYLPKAVAPVAEIAEPDVIEQTLEISVSETEDLKTKVIASWKPDHITKPFFVIVRYNIPAYGLHERRDNYFTYNMQQLVEKSATFWTIREANSWKRVTLKLPFTKLNIETMDTVRLNFTNSFVSDGPIDCLVEGSSVDTNDYTVTLNLWVPIRAGEMKLYPWAYTGDLTVQYVWPTPDDVKQERTSEVDGVRMPNPVPGNPKVTKPMSGDQGNGGTFHVSHRRLSWGADPSYIVDNSPPNESAPTILTRVNPGTVTPLGTKPPGTTKYQIDRAKITKVAIAADIVSQTLPAKVTSGSGDTYTCSVYLEGVKNDPIVVDGIKQLQIDSGETVPAGTWVMVTKTVKKTSTREGKTSYDVNWYMQVPVWL